MKKFTMGRGQTRMNADKIKNQKSKINPTLRRIIGYAFALAVLFFLGRLLVQTWDQIAASGFKFEFDLPRLLLSLILLIVARAFAVEAWRRVLLSFGERLDFAFGVRVWFLSNLTRYVPGNIWQVATMLVMVEQKGVSKTNALLSQVVYTALALAIAGLLGLMFFLMRPEILQGILDPGIVPYAPLIAVILFSALMIFFALPPVNRGLVALTARITRRAITAPTPTFARGLVPPIFSLLMWLTNGIAFYLFADSITPVAPANLLAFIAMNAGAYWIGYVSFITPSGLGFREGALAWMLASFFPAPVAVALALATRLWATAGELLGVLLVWISQMWEHK
ncbi:MAG: flippase-like domain-containing protein [Chloroflexi bacterium]|nr:flippase-like domain-containing protein [Chloroflexota bacterium]